MFTRPMTGMQVEKQAEILHNVADLIDSKVLVHTNEIVKKFDIQNITESMVLISGGKMIGKLALSDVD